MNIMKALGLASILAVAPIQLVFATVDDGIAAHENGSYKKAFFEFMAESNNHIAQYYIGDMYYNGYGLLQNYNLAAEWFAKAAQQGDMDAQFNIAVMYANGDGVNQDKKKAFDWYSKAAEQGNAAAQFNLGLMYDNNV